MSEAIEEQEKRDLNTVQLGPKSLDIPEEWEKKPLDELNSDDADICYGVLKPGSDVYQGVPLIKIEDIEHNRVAEKGFHRISEELHEKYSRSVINGGEVLISIQGTIGRVAIVPEDFQESNISRTIARITPNEGTDGIWLKSYLLSKVASDYMEIVSSGSTRASLNIGALRKVPILTPPLPEQRRLADILSTVDEQIRLTDRVIEKTEELRYGLMSEFFHTGYYEHSLVEKPTLGQVPDDWDVCELSEVAEIEMGSSPKSKYYNEEGEGLPFYQANNEFDYRNPTHDRWCSKPNKIANEGDTLVTIRGTYVGQVNVANDKCCIGRGLAAVSAEKVDQEYLYHYLSHRERYVKSIASGSTFDSINSSELESLSVLVPSRDEQEKIASCLKSLQEKYMAERQYKQKLQEVKRGLMQDLLTGKVRVNTNN